MWGEEVCQGREMEVSLVQMRTDHTKNRRVLDVRHISPLAFGLVCAVEHVSLLATTTTCCMNGPNA